MEGEQSKNPLSEILRREMGLSHPLRFVRRIGGSEAFVKRIHLYGKLKGHRGCVNTVHFNPSGDVLISGSDDTQIKFWNWAAKSKLFSYPSGHLDNVFEARIMPFTDDRAVITSAADGQVRLGQIADDGQVITKLLGEHRGCVHMLVVEPGSPHIFYSCGADGFVQHFDLRTNSATKLFLCSASLGSRRPIPLNSIVIDPRNPNCFAVGGFDKYARVYDIRNFQPDASSSMDQPVNTFAARHLLGTNNAHITALAYSNASELLIAYKNEHTYLFQKEMGIGPYPQSISVEELQKLDGPQVYSGHRNSQTIKGVSFFGPNDEYVASGSACGHVFIWKKKGGELIRIMEGDVQIVDCVEPHPHSPVLATSGLEKSVKLWAPTANKLVPLPQNADKIIAANSLEREDYGPVMLLSDAMTHFLRQSDAITHFLRRRRQLTMGNSEQRSPGTESDSDDDDEEETSI